MKPLKIILLICFPMHLFATVGTIDVLLSGHGTSANPVKVFVRSATTTQEEAGTVSFYIYYNSTQLTVNTGSYNYSNLSSSSGFDWNSSSANLPTITPAQTGSYTVGGNSYNRRLVFNYFDDLQNDDYWPASTSSYMEIFSFEFNSYSGTPTIGITVDSDGFSDHAYSTPGHSVTIMNANNIHALPVDLISFDVTRFQETSAKLTWATASETNNKGFFIERSLNGSDWQPISFVETKALNGNSQYFINYSFIDNNVYFLRSKTVYYRLRQQDFNGTEEYVGGIKTIRFDAEVAEVISVGPNPATSVLNIKNSSGENLEINFSDVNGRVLFSEKTKESIRLNTSLYQDGIYIIQAKNFNGDILETQKVFINNN